MQLRTLQTIDGLGPSVSNTVVLAVPIEIMGLLTDSILPVLQEKSQAEAHVLAKIA
jgi:hypothetical protein